MIACVYTSQKQKKAKTWRDGYVKVAGKKLSLYDTDGMLLCSSAATAINGEIETPRYLIFVENFDGLANSEPEKPGGEEGAKGSTRSKKAVCEEVPLGRTENEILNLFDQ
jgi:hypothetical protein